MKIAAIYKFHIPNILYSVYSPIKTLHQVHFRHIKPSIHKEYSAAQDN